MKRGILAFGVAGLCAAHLAAAEPVVWHSRTSADSFEVTAVVAPGFFLNTEGLFFTVRDSRKKLLEPERAPEDPGEAFSSGRYVWLWRGDPPFSATVDFQCCRAAGGSQSPTVCLMPQRVALAGEPPPKKTPLPPERLPLELDRWRVVRTAGGVMDEAAFLAFLRNGETANVQGSLGGFFAGAGVWMVIFLTLAGGFLLNLTPCILPLIPVNLAIIGAAQGGRRGALAGVAYGGGMALSYGISGAAVVLAGGVMGNWHGSWLFQWGVAALFLFFALGMAGFIPLDFSRFRNFDRSKWRGGRLAAAFLAGGVAALLAGACVAPVTLGVLLYAGTRYQEGAYAALFLPLLLGVGMALPWPLAGAGIGVLPRPGRFMVWIKYGFAAMLFALFCWYGWQGVQLLPGRKVSTAAAFERLETAMREARRSGRPLLVEFGASWCKNCAVMKRTTFARPAVRKEMAARWVFCDFPAEDPGDPAIAELFRRWEVKGIPAFVVLKNDGR